MTEPLTFGAAIALAIAAVRLAERAIEAVVQRRRNGNGSTTQKSVLTTEESLMLRDVHTWKDRYEASNHAFQEKLLDRLEGVSLTQRDTISLIQRLMDRLSLRD